MELTVFHNSKIGFMRCIGYDWPLMDERLASAPSDSGDILPIECCSIIDCSKTCGSKLCQIYFLFQFQYGNIKGFCSHLLIHIVISKRILFMNMNFLDIPPLFNSCFTQSFCVSKTMFSNSDRYLIRS